MKGHNDILYLQFCPSKVYLNVWLRPARLHSRALDFGLEVCPPIHTSAGQDDYHSSTSAIRGKHRSSAWTSGDHRMVDRVLVSCIRELTAAHSEPATHRAPHALPRPLRFRPRSHCSERNEAARGCILVVSVAPSYKCACNIVPPCHGIIPRSSSHPPSEDGIDNRDMMHN